MVLGEASRLCHCHKHLLGKLLFVSLRRYPRFVSTFKIL
ncbi:uncharacterized protein J3R85_009164 [Psidium guajava]|nr:uncharacterized protein J3R85_009164 [Psidium guajava]